jgi:uncharacterized protein
MSRDNYRNAIMKINFTEMAAKLFSLRTSRKIWANFALLVAALVAEGQSIQPAEPANQGPPDWIAWQHQRHESIGGSNGWTTLIALYWLPVGKTSVGTDRSNQFVLPEGRASGSVGEFFRKANLVQFNAAPGVAATSDGAAVTDLEMKTDATEKPTKLKIGSLSFVVIERAERFGVRVRDPESPARLHFAGLHYFPYDSSWRIEGRFEKFPSTRTLRVPDASGGIQELQLPGSLVFSRGGKEYRLDAVEEGGDEYFIIFTDGTAGKSTYGAGRFLYVKKQDAAGHVTIDFNRAFTPPCGFTRYATCPKPPPQNSLTFEVPAGELYSGEEH